MYFKRIVVGASIVCAAALPITSLSTGIAGAEPVASKCPQPAPVDVHEEAPPCDVPPSSATGDDGLALSPALSNQLNQAVANLPSPVQVDVPVNMGFGLGLPGIALPGLSVPVVLGGVGAPGIGVPQLPAIGPPQLPAPPQLPF
ncbi:MAG: hypothetical protein ABW137_23255 [Mycobacterium sp.]